MNAYTVYGPNRRNGAYVVKTPEHELIGGELTKDEATMLVGALNGTGNISEMMDWLNGPRGKKQGFNIERHLVERGAKAAVYAALAKKLN